MGELEDSINQVLNDPLQMEKISNLARSLMGGGGENKGQEIPPFDPKLMQKISGLMRDGGAKNSKDEKLLDAMRPFLSEKRRGRMDRAVRLAKMARLASIAAEEFGGEGDV